jgi:Ni/Fe-hydrogenase subunit HybB-like protein
MKRANTLKSILWAIVGLAAAVGISRFILGLGAVTNLSDSTPWGLWIGFDVMGGVALAAGGFVITAIVYILRRDEFHPIVRPAVLTAFLGYVAVIISLLFDLGLPWNIWHMIVFWNPHSPLFEVGWCVMLYTTVLLLEFSPVPLEESSRYAKIRQFLMRFRFPLVLLGIMFSTLHQSSLGSLLLIVPFKLHPLWYSRILPVLFFISAVGLGLMMVTLESLVSGYIYHRKPETHLLSKLAKAAIWVLSIYLIVRLTDIIIAGKFGLIFSGSWEGVLFMVELLIAAVIPIVLFSISRIRNSAKGLWVGSIMVVFGFVFYRINAAGITMLRAVKSGYFPSWMEFVTSAGVVSLAVLIFLYAVEKFNIWETKPSDPADQPFASPRFDKASMAWLGTSPTASRAKFSLIFVGFFALGFAFIPGKKIESRGILEVRAVRALGGDTLFIDGNRDGFGVAFDHKMHQQKNGGDSSCVICHHLNLPMDRNSGCYSCHSSMYQSTSTFNHTLHADGKYGDISCVECHPAGQIRNVSTAAKCDKCHKDMLPAEAKMDSTNYRAPSYVNALHLLCVNCHKKKALELTDKKNLGLCITCHHEPNQIDEDSLRIKYVGRTFNRVIFPWPDTTRQTATAFEKVSQ